MNIFTLLSVINNLYKQKQFFFKLSLQSSTLKLLKVLVRLNLILYYFIKFNFIYIYLNYFHFKPVISYIKLISTPSKKVIIKLTELRLLTILYSTSIVLLSTPFGYISHLEALKLKTGGILVAQYY